MTSFSYNISLNGVFYHIKLCYCRLFAFPSLPRAHIVHYFLFHLCNATAAITTSTSTTIEAPAVVLTQTPNHTRLLIRMYTHLWQAVTTLPWYWQNTQYYALETIPRCKLSSVSYTANAVSSSIRCCSYHGFKSMKIFDIWIKQLMVGREDVL